MRLLIIVLTMVIFSSCAKSSHPSAAGSSAIATTSPSCTFYIAGSRTFCNGVNATATAYDCDMSEGKHCWKFIHTPDSSDSHSYEDFVCVDPGSSGEECAGKM